MEFVKLDVHPREDVGKGFARKLRAEGKVPAVYYGGGVEPRVLSVDYGEIGSILKAEGGRHQLLNLNMPGEKKELSAVIKDYQLDPVTHRVLHVDFLAIREDRPITVDIPVVLSGESQAVEDGGMVEQREMTLRVSCLPKNLPRAIEVDVSHLRLGDYITLGEIELSEGVEVDGEDDMVLAIVVRTRMAKLLEEIEEAAAGEVEPEEAEEEAEEAPEEEEETEES